MTKRNAEILLAAVIFARSTSLVFAKAGLNSLSPFNLLAVRFAVAFATLTLIFFKKLSKAGKGDVLRGAALGGLFFLVMAAEMYTLKLTDASTTSFLENTAIVIVPLLQAAALRRAPGGRVMISALLTLLGVALLTLRGGLSIGFGELLGMTTALLYAFAIILTDKLSRKGDPLLLGVFQVGFMGVFSALASFGFERPRLPANGAEWGIILMLALVCSCFGFTLQPVAQRYTTAERASQFCAINPLSVAVLGAVFMNERLGAFGYAGAALILSGIAMQSFAKKQPES